MNAASRRIRNSYLLLNALIWLPTSLIVGINTLFLLDGGLNNVEAFAANAFYTVGLALFELPTGMVADTWGRRASFLIGAATQLVGNLTYVGMWYIHGPFWGWAAASVLLGLGFTFFSGALEAWMVDALKASGYTDELEPIFAKGQIINGSAMLVGTIAGGYLAQLTNFGFPYLVRAALQLVSFFVALAIMKDLGFVPSANARLVDRVRELAAAAKKYGIDVRPIRWVMLAAPFYMGTGIYGFYAAQPYLLELFGDRHAVGVAGIAAAGIAGTQILGGFAVPLLAKLFRRRTDILIASAALTALALVLIGSLRNFYVVVGLLVLWAAAYAATLPVRQAYLNALIPSEQRATLLSLDSMIDSLGGVAFQPVLGRLADAFGYAVSYVASGVIALVSLPFLVAARRERAESDPIRQNEPGKPESARSKG
jgi:MFS family permease